MCIDVPSRFMYKQPAVYAAIAHTINIYINNIAIYY